MNPDFRDGSMRQECAFELLLWERSHWDRNALVDMPCRTVLSYVYSVFVRDEYVIDRQ